VPSALEKLVKILKLERDQGYNNTAVVGGLSNLSQGWVNEAHGQARKPEHHLLVDELVKLFQDYEQADNSVDRHNMVQYMLDRITGRVPPPPEYQAATETTSPPPVQPAPSRPPSQPKPAPARAAPSESPAKPPPGPAASPDIPASPRLARPPRQRQRPTDAEEAADIMRGLNAPVSQVKGVGERMAGSFARLGVHTIKDLLYFLPRDYDDYREQQPISNLLPETKAKVIGTVRQTEVRAGKGGRKDFFMVVDDGSGMLNVTFFGQHYLGRDIKPNQQVSLRGRTTFFSNRIQMSNPEWEHLDPDNLLNVGIVPIYRLTDKLKARGLRRLMKSAVSFWAKRIPDYMPEATLDRAELAGLGWAFENIHFPEGWDHLHHARRRLTFDELLLLQLAVLGNRRDWQGQPATPLDIPDEALVAFQTAVFPYPLTGAQQRVIEDIRRDIRSDIPMNRLLQGDVGSGKTAVAICAIAAALHSGKQAALMAPTGILAEQHFRNVSEALARMPAERPPVVALLTGSLSSAEREAAYTGLADGSIDVVIGTHALIQAGVEYHNLGLAIVDEQHRFGVEQRGALRGKGSNPHLLVMTATPIPRTLALTIHADLDLSIIDEMPPGRTPIQTRIVEPVATQRVYNFVEDQLQKGHQAFMVHPLVEQSETIDAKSAVEAYEHLKKVFFRYKVGLLHGRMKPAEKDQVMADFSSGAYHVLVTTSVAEVGVDVPNATVIVIEGANRFGLAQLHQFRGRVGRGQHASYCLLIPDNVPPEAEERVRRGLPVLADEINWDKYLDAIKKGTPRDRVLAMLKQDQISVQEFRLRALELTTDGFLLSEIDWVLRGAGDLLGTRQSGGDLYAMAEFVTPDLVELAQREARTIYEEDPALAADEHRLLAERVRLLQNIRADIS
jgi:ATP-dependent DNA helicase RecG